jgi:hypothetical protein
MREFEALRKRLFVGVLAAASAGAASAHPHAGGLVVLPDGTVMAGDVLGSRILVIAPDGTWRAYEDVGHLRGLARTTDGTTYGVTWGSGGGVWVLEEDGRRTLVSLAGGRDGLIAAGGDGALLFAPVDAMGVATRIDSWLPPDPRQRLVSVSDVTAFTHHAGGTAIAVGDRVALVIGEEERELAAGLRGGIHGLASSQGGLIVAHFGGREVVLIGDDGRRRVLLASEPPWAPTDVAFVDGSLYVLELAQHACCWKGPRVRRVAADGSVTTLVNFDAGSHLHVSPRDRPMQWLVGSMAVAAVSALTLVRRRRRGGHESP